MTYKEELINSIEANFVFSKKPINRFKISETNIDKNNPNKNEKIIFRIFRLVEELF